MIRAALLVAMLALAPAAAAAQVVWETLPDAPAMPETAETGTADVNGIAMHYALFGEETGEPPILLIHGGLAHADLWAAQVADLMADHRVIVADTRGHGRSTNDGSPYGYDLLARDYLALLDALDVDRVHLVGWSDGANIGFALSQIAPDRLASHFAHAGNVTLAGIDPAVETDPVFGAYVAAMGEDYAALSPTPDGFDGFLGGVAAMWGTEKPGGLEALEAVDVPTLVVQSEHDEAILDNHARAIAEALPNGEYLLLEDVSHFASLQAPDAYAAAIRRFVDAR